MSEGAEASDNDLARRAAAGDDAAFGQLVSRHKHNLYRLLRRYTGDPDEAYEAVQEAFIAAWSALDRYDAERAFGAWLRTIAINKARDRVRRARVRRLLFGSAPPEESEVAAVADPGESAEAAVMRRQRISRLDRAIADLPPRLKEPLLLTALDGLTHQEAGAILAVSAKTIETRVYRARKILAERMGADLHPAPPATG